MQQVQDDAFERFAAQRKKDLQRIARHTRGEHQLADVVQEAWVMTRNLQTPEGKPLDLTDSACQQRLLSHLYQHLVRYTEQNVHRAVRLDHAPAGFGQDGNAHPLTYLLVSDEGHNPLSDLLEKETASQLEANLAAHGSLAAAYVHLLRHFDTKMVAVAEHLRISNSYAYRRCAQARWLTTQIRHIPVPVVDERFIPGPWRKFRLRKTPVQLAFDFETELPLH